MRNRRNSHAQRLRRVVVLASCFFAAALLTGCESYDKSVYWLRNPGNTSKDDYATSDTGHGSDASDRLDRLFKP